MQSGDKALGRGRMQFKWNILCFFYRVKTNSRF